MGLFGPKKEVTKYRAPPNSEYGDVPRRQVKELKISLPNEPDISISVSNGKVILKEEVTGELRDLFLKYEQISDVEEMKAFIQNNIGRIKSLSKDYLK